MLFEINDQGASERRTNSQDACALGALDHDNTPVRINFRRLMTERPRVKA